MWPLEKNAIIINRYEIILDEMNSESMFLEWNLDATKVDWKLLFVTMDSKSHAIYT